MERCRLKKHACPNNKELPVNPTQHTVNPAVYRPVLFFAWSLLLPWAAWLAAAYLSHQPDGGHTGLLTALLLVGLLAPMCLAAGLLWRQPSLRADALSRLRFSGTSKRYLLLLTVWMVWKEQAVFFRQPDTLYLGKYCNEKYLKKWCGV